MPDSGGHFRRFRLPAGRPPRVGIVAKIAAAETRETVRTLVGWLKRRGVEVTMEDGLAAAVAWSGRSAPLAGIGVGQDFILLLGGDGTLLAVTRAMAEDQRPVFGVNLGSLGFLTQAPLDQLYTGLEAILAGRGILDVRATLVGILMRNGREVARQHAVNDVVVTGGAIARVIGVRLKTTQGFLANVLGDGVIVATPTGSTAYNLGAGGPVVDPAVEAIILAPIVPLTLTQRPVVFSDSEELSLTLRPRGAEVYVTFDGQANHPFRPGDVLRIRKSRRRIRMLGVGERNYFRVLRKKLLWSALPPKRAPSRPPTPPDS